MATGTAGSSARKFHTTQTHYLRCTATYAQPNGGLVGILPAGAIIVRGATYIWQGFNDTTADDIDVGIVGETDRYVSAVDCNSAATTAFDDLANANAEVTTDQPVYWKFSTAATGDGSTGRADIVIEYIV